MSDMDTDLVVAEPSELEALKARADMLGVKYHPSIKVEKLREKVNAAVEGEPEDEEAPVIKKPNVAELQRKANELVRVRISCMNPAKKEWEGEIFTVGNASVGTLKKYIPFNTDEGWHVPRMILEQIKARECQVFVTKRDSRGNNVRSGKLIKEFAVEELPPLTEAELKDLAQRQAMAKSIG